MATPKFRIRKKTGTAQVYYDIFIKSGVRLFGKTDVIIDTRYWNDGIDLNKASNIGKKKEAISNDTNLDSFLEWYEKEGVGAIKSKEEVKNLIDIYYKRAVLEEKTSLDKYFEEHIIYLQEEKQVKYRTVWYYEHIQKLMKEFCKKKKLPFIYETFTNKNTILFKKYLRETHKASDGTWNAYLHKLKAVMLRAYDLEYHNMRQFKVAKAVEVKTFDVYLTEKEVQSIRDLKLDNKIDQAIRDYCVLLCRTGERIIDVIGGERPIGKDKDGNLIKEALKFWDHKTVIENGVLKLRLTALKTGKTRHFVVTDELKPILKRWALLGHEYGFPNEHLDINIKYQAFSSRVRKIARLAGIDYKVKNSPEDVDPKFKWEYIKPHTFRRTAVTLAYLSGTEIDEIRRTITLHKDDSTTINYIKANNSEIEGIMRDRKDIA